MGYFTIKIDCSLGHFSRAAIVSCSGVDVFELWKKDPCKLANTLLFAPYMQLAERLLLLTRTFRSDLVAPRMKQLGKSDASDQKSA